MPTIPAFGYPVEVLLEHSGTPVGYVDDEWSEEPMPVYRIEKVYWTEKSGRGWRVVVQHPSTGQPVMQEIGPYESGSKNLPTPARFDSYPLTIHCSIMRG